jgi:dihydroflavonol-4-reductase
VIGDLRDRETLRRALDGAWGVVHSAGWVSLGRDRAGLAREVNVEATGRLLDDAAAAGVRRFVHTSTLWTVAAGTPESPADEDAAWNLDVVRCPYCDTKREAERVVLGRDGSGLRTMALCPGLVIGPRDVRPTSTRLFLELARAGVLAVLPKGGIPVVDAGVLAQAHLRALTAETSGMRLIVAGPYLSYLEMAGLVARLTGSPRRVVALWDAFRPALRGGAWAVERLGLGPSDDFSPAAVSGGFLRLRASGGRADALFGLVHPPPIRSIFEALESHRRSGLAPWLDLRAPED